MASKNRRNKRKDRLTPPTPEQIRQRKEAAENSRLERESVKKAESKRVENWGLNEDGGLYDYQRHIGTEIKRDERGRAKAVWRSNPFVLLLRSGSLTQDEANAAHDLMTIYARSKGLAGAPETSGIIIDGGDPDAWGAEDARQYNIRLYAMISEAMSSRSARLARAFSVAIVEEDRPMSWRGIVERETGDTNPVSQTTWMRAMCGEMLDVIPKCRKSLREWIEARAA